MDQERTPIDIVVDPERGLSSEEVAFRIKQKQVNRTKKRVSKPTWKILFDNFCNPFNLILLVVTVVMIWGRLSFTHFIFAFVYGANIAIGIYQDFHARILIEHLKVLSEGRCLVLRDGQEIEVRREEIVLNDVLILKAGDQIPADAILRKGHCACDESLLTGESLAAQKKPGDTLLSGSYVRSGSCVAEATQVGENSYAEKLQKTASAFARPKSEIAQTIWDITVTCAIVATAYGIAYVLVGFGTGTIQWGDFIPMGPNGTEFIEGLSGAMVAMLPTGMFLLTSVALTTGVIHLAKKDMLVQELYSLEMLARVDIVCFDKTGTLTDGNMSVEEIVPMHGHSMLEIGFGVSAILDATQDNNATAKALRERFGGRNKVPTNGVIPFDSERKLSAVSLREGGSYVVGAYGYVPSKKEDEITLLLQSYEKKGYRCLVLGYSKNCIENGVLPKNYEICGVLVLSDHIKEDAKSNIKWFMDNGVDIYVISGDNPITVSEIAKRCGVPMAERFVDMSGVKDEEIPGLVSSCRVFGRVLPEQKRKIVLAMREQGHKVAMTGDGVNDILALKAADCSIAMASGASAAKNAAHLICTKSDFSSLPDVVAQGRRVINNLQRSCSLFLCKTIFAMTVSTAFFISVLCGGPKYPFSTSHMLVWEIFAVGIPSFFLALQPNSDRLEGSLLKNIVTKAVPSGVAEVICVAVPFLVYAILPRAISYNAHETYIDTVSLCIITFSAFSYWTLFRVCQPMNKYRAAVFGSCFALGLLIFGIDFFVRTPEGRGVLLQFMWGGFAWSYPLVMLVVLSLAIGVYYILVYFIRIRPKRRRSEHDHQ
ncbi:MAG: HAD-IC family P-type ATPase [Bacilli bacterium]|nr:HAD-IC family P-type ATPase [Bacilli bacterium]